MFFTKGDARSCILYVAYLELLRERKKSKSTFEIKDLEKCESIQSNVVDVFFAYFFLTTGQKSD